MYIVGAGDLFFYVEGFYFLCGGRTGLVKWKAWPFFVSIVREPFLEILLFFFFSSLFIKNVVRVEFFSFLRRVFYAVVFGYLCKFKFESRLYRLRHRITSCVFRLGFVRRLDYCLPISLYIRAKRKKSMHFYYSVYGLDFFMVRKISSLFRSFRIPNMYSRLGIFLRPEKITFREGMKHMRV